MNRKEEFIKKIEEAHRACVEVLSRVGEEEWVEPKTCGEWSVKDVVAHMAEWQQRALDWYETGKRGERPKAPDEIFTWEQIDEINQIIWEGHRDESIETVRTNFEESYQDVLKAVQGMSEKVLFEPHQFEWLGDYLLGDVIADNTCNHYDEHRKSMQAWLERKQAQA